LGRVRSLGSVGWVLGLGLAATVLSLWPDHPEWAWVAAAAVALTAPRAPRRQPAADERRRPEEDATPTLRRLPLGRVLAVVGLVFPASMAMSGLVQFTAGWAHTELAAGPFLAVAPIALSAALELPVFPWVDRLVAVRSPLAVAVLAGPPLALATVLLAAWPSSLTMLGVQPLVAVSFALLFMGQSRLLAQAVPAARQGSAQTLGSALSLGCGGLIAGIVGGRLAESFGYQGLFVGLAAVALAGTALGCVAWAWSRRALGHGARSGQAGWLLAPARRPAR
jgi:MFS transporter, PPP family, 3-phenylpropionic acid transporter